MYISIIIPLYNKADYISKSINSILRQTYQNFELIVVNDGSTDNSVDVVKQFSDKRIRIINQQNQGVSTARNIGVENASYDYISFLDADDWWNQDFLKEMVTLIHEYPQAALYACKYAIVKNRTFEEQFDISDFNKGYFNYANTFLKTNRSPIWTSALVVKKELFLKIGGFNISLRYGEDLDLWLRFSIMYKIAYLNKTLAYYNYDVASDKRAISNITPGKESFFIFNLESFFEYERENEEFKRLLDILRLRFLKPYYIQGLYKDEVKLILSNVTYMPLKFRCFYKLPPKFLRSLYINSFS